MPYPCRTPIPGHADRYRGIAVLCFVKDLKTFLSSRSSWYKVMAVACVTVVHITPQSSLRDSIKRSNTVQSSLEHTKLFDDNSGHSDDVLLGLKVRSAVTQQ